MRRVRLDELLVIRGYFSSKSRAKAEIMSGNVFVDGVKIEKAGTYVNENSHIEIKEKMPYVSRGALKLKKAIEKFNINVKDKICLDIGSSTGGFVDLLLEKGAKKVYAVDVNVKQLHYRLSKNKKIIKIEKNARYLKLYDFDETPEIITIDVSFISVLKILPAIKEINKDAKIIVLIKPQFEGKRSDVKKGIVKDKKTLYRIILTVLEKISELGFNVVGLTESPIKGQKGNREFLILIDNKSLKRYNNILIKEVIFGEDRHCN